MKSIFCFSTRIHKFILSRSSMPSRHTEVWPPDLLHEEITWPQGEVEVILREATKMNCQRNLGIPKVVKKNSRDTLYAKHHSINKGTWYASAHSMGRDDKNLDIKFPKTRRILKQFSSMNRNKIHLVLTQFYKDSVSLCQYILCIFARYVVKWKPVELKWSTHE